MKWEYKIVQFDIRGLFRSRVDPKQMETELNNLGAEGWELAKVTGILKDFGATSGLVATLKRPRT